MAHNSPGGPQRPSTSSASQESVHSRDLRDANLDNSASTRESQTIITGAEGVAQSGGPSVARVAPVLSLLEWRSQDRQDQIDRMLEMVDDLRKDIIAGRITTLAFAGVTEGKEFCQWDGDDAQVLYVLELAKAELVSSVRFGVEDDEE